MPPEGAHQMWIGEKEDIGEILDKALSKWILDVSANELLFREHVFDNPDVNELDLRQHRGRLYALLADGEHLALGPIEYATRTEPKKDVSAKVNLLDQELKALFDDLVRWHGSLETQSACPEGFKQAVKEAAEGKIVDLDL